MRDRVIEPIEDKKEQPTSSSMTQWLNLVPMAHGFIEASLA
ncbi:MAG: hypothetical protein ACLQOO_17925 [Terriglobia bacterium]